MAQETKTGRSDERVHNSMTDDETQNLSNCANYDGSVIGSDEQQQMRRRVEDFPSSSETENSQPERRGSLRRLLQKISLRKHKLILAADPKARDRSPWERFGVKIEDVVCSENQQSFQAVIVTRISTRKYGNKIKPNVILMAVDGIKVKTMQEPFEEVMRIFDERNVVEVEFSRNPVTKFHPPSKRQRKPRSTPNPHAPVLHEQHEHEPEHEHEHEHEHESPEEQFSEPDAATSASIVEAHEGTDHTISDNSADCFCPCMTREEACDLLAPAMDGAFIIRSREQCPNQLVLSLMFHSVHHMRIYCTQGLYHFSQTDPRFVNLTSLVDFYRNHSLGSIFTEVPLTLRYPYGNESLEAYELSIRHPRFGSEPTFRSSRPDPYMHANLQPVWPAEQVGVPPHVQAAHLLVPMQPQPQPSFVQQPFQGAAFAPMPQDQQQFAAAAQYPQQPQQPQQPHPQQAFGGQQHQFAPPQHQFVALQPPQQQQFAPQLYPQPATQLQQAAAAQATNHVGAQAYQPQSQQPTQGWQQPFSKQESLV